MWLLGFLFLAFKFMLFSWKFDPFMCQLQSAFDFESSDQKGRVQSHLLVGLFPLFLYELLRGQEAEVHLAWGYRVLVAPPHQGADPRADQDQLIGQSQEKGGPRLPVNQGLVSCLWDIRVVNGAGMNHCISWIPWKLVLSSRLIS